MTRELVHIGDGRVLAQYGPMRLAIDVHSERGPDSEMAADAAEYAFSLLPRLVPAKKMFSRGNYASTLKSGFEEQLFNQMIQAVEMVRWPDLGPMATVAGMISESVALFLKEAGAVRAIVENGGDLAIFLTPGQTASVGIRLGVMASEPVYKMTLRGDRHSLWGVCSSGLGGRSLTQGLADTALCVAASAVVADAAATALGNACNVQSPKVRRILAETVEPDTDIAGLLVTESVADLSESEIDAAIDNASIYAHGLVHDGVIMGAVVSLGGKVAVTGGFADKVASLELI